MANTQIGVRSITQEINVRMAELIVSTIDFTWSISSLFADTINATQNMIHIVTICMALSVTNDSTILSGMSERRNHEKLSVVTSAAS